MPSTDIIAPQVAKTLDGLFAERVRLLPNAIAYLNYDETADIWISYS